MIFRFSCLKTSNLLNFQNDILEHFFPYSRHKNWIFWSKCEQIRKRLWMWSITGEIFNKKLDFLCSDSSVPNWRGFISFFINSQLPPISLNYDPPLAKKAHQTVTTPFIENYHIPTPIKSMQRDCVRKEVNYINFLNNFP